MSLSVEVFIMEAEDALTTWMRAEDEDGNVVYSRELTGEEVQDGAVRLNVSTRAPSNIAFRAEWYKLEDGDVPIEAPGLSATGVTSLKLHLGESQ